MIIIRNENRIQRLKRISQITSLAGMGALLAGLVLVFTSDGSDTRVFFYQLLALLIGWILSQVGIYLAHRYVRNPRPDEVIDEAVRGAAKNGRLYHYVLGAPHVLLNPDGIVVLVAKFQGGKITVEGDKWKQSGLGLRRFFGQEGLGNPTKEAETSVEIVASFLNKHAPQVEEVPIAPLIVFTTKGVTDLDLKGSRIPAMHYTKVKGFLKQNRRKEMLPEADYDAIRRALDAKAGFMEEEIAEETAVS